VGGLSNLRQQLMDMKETVLETCVAELKNAVVGKKMKDTSRVWSFLAQRRSVVISISSLTIFSMLVVFNVFLSFCSFTCSGGHGTVDEGL